MVGVKRCVLFSMGLLLTLLMISPGASRAEQASGPRKITRLGTQNAFFLKKGLLSEQDVRQMASKYRDDIARLLAESGYSEDTAGFFAAIESGPLWKTDLQPGAEMEWMMFRKKGQARLDRNLVWAGKRPAPIFRFEVEVVDRAKGRKQVYSFSVPRQCGNIALTGMRSVPLVPEPPKPAAPAPKPEAKPEAKPEEKMKGEAKPSITAKACPPPTCDLRVGPTTVYTGQPIAIDASGSKAEADGLKQVTVRVSRQGQKEKDIVLPVSLKTTVAYDQAGDYSFMATAGNSCGQDSTNVCQANVTVLSRWGFFVSAMGGAETRDRENDDDDFDTSTESTLAMRGGVSYLLIPDRLQMAGALGYYQTFNHGKYSSLFADLYLDYLAKPWTLGVGLGGWALTRGDDAAPTFLAHVDYDLPWTINRKPVQLTAEGRVFLDALDRIGANHVLLLGLKFNF